MKSDSGGQKLSRTMRGVLRDYERIDDPDCPRYVARRGAVPRIVASRRIWAWVPPACVVVVSAMLALMFG